MERVERMHWRLIVEKYWDNDILALAHKPIPDHLTGQERIDFHKARVEAGRRLAAFFPEDEEPP